MLNGLNLLCGCQGTVSGKYWQLLTQFHVTGMWLCNLLVISVEVIVPLFVGEQNFSEAGLD